MNRVRNLWQQLGDEILTLDNFGDTITWLAII
jgi:hypothetical protein